MPSELIASYPKNPPESAKLLVYDRLNNTITHTIFKNLFDFLPQNTSIILNDTKVIKARIYGNKLSGGKVEVLLNSPLNECSFKAYIKGKVKVGTIINIEQNISLHVEQLYKDGMRKVRFLQNQEPLHVEQIYEILETIGHVPLPPYIKREDNKEDERDYQSLFAKNRGAVAAPTASLHFSSEMIERLHAKYKSAFVTLHVGAGTFKAVETENITSHRMHEEHFSISKEAKKILLSDETILAVGTTVTRVVEYFQREKRLNGYCQLFLHPKNKPQRVNHLLTNFHLPKSTLLMLVASFAGLEKSMDIYKEAISKKYRFFSYGDAMLIL